MFVKDFGGFGTLCVNCAALDYLDLGDMLEFYSYEVEEEIIKRIIECNADYRTLDSIEQSISFYKVSLIKIIMNMIADPSVGEDIAIKLMRYLRK